MKMTEGKFQPKLNSPLEDGVSLPPAHPVTVPCTGELTSLKQAMAAVVGNTFSKPGDTGYNISSRAPAEYQVDFNPKRRKRSANSSEFPAGISKTNSNKNIAKLTALGQEGEEQ